MRVFDVNFTADNLIMKYLLIYILLRVVLNKDYCYISFKALVPTRLGSQQLYYLE